MPVSLPPGLSNSEPESATASRERRRVALAAKVSVDQLAEALAIQLNTIETKLDRALNSHNCNNLEHRVARLEVLSVCSPSADEVLDQMFEKRKADQASVGGFPCIPPFPTQRFNIYDEHVDAGVQVGSSEQLTSAIMRSTETQTMSRHCCESASQTNVIQEPANVETSVQANAVDELSPQLDELKSKLHGVAAYRTLCDIGNQVYSDEVDQGLASYIDDALRTSGEWIPIPNGHGFQIGDMVKVRNAFVPSQDGVEIRLKPGYRGLVHFIDQDGDAQAWFPDLLFAGLRGKHVGHWILQGERQNLELRTINT